jgi:hypothetical protein
VAVGTNQVGEAGGGGGADAPSAYAATDRTLVRKTALFAPFIYKNDHFAKTGSGQT